LTPATEHRHLIVLAHPTRQWTPAGQDNCGPLDRTADLDVRAGHDVGSRPVVIPAHDDHAVVGHAVGGPHPDDGAPA